MSERRPAASGGHWGELDTLRFLSACLVMAFHYLGTDSQGSRWHGQHGDVYGFAAWDAVSRLGALGVDLFFFISGLVIAHSANGARPAAFAASRFTRLMPTYWLAVLLTAGGILWAGEGYRSLDGLQVLANLLCLQRVLGVEFVDGVYWSLLVEMRFYLLVMLLLVCRQFHHYPRWLGVWAVFVGLDAAGVALGPLRQALVLSQAPWFILGGAAWLQTQGRRREAWLLFAAMLSLIVARQYGKYAQHGMAEGVLAALTVSGMALLVMAVPLGRLPWLRLRHGAALAALTYPLYLLHEDLGFVLMRELWLGSAGATVAGVACAALGLAWLVVRAFERPLLPPLRRWLTQRLDRIAALRRAGPAVAPPDGRWVLP
ncbi:acyltransferase [Pelomonas sp. APW6]|uniref:Acyltransferase n=1 Tax=Roseateles subflavus TaxID=3053353 RepID=A0ABT7LJD0_9BURK|nr:acyltransferase [Pelomonas sp. APW6]MDL5032957.1 acyltransferase [Pelomonas sp. APW6]